MQQIKLCLKILVFMAAFIFLAGITTGFANSILFEMFGEPNQEEVSNFLKNDWTTCDGIYYPDSAKQTTFEL